MTSFAFIFGAIPLAVALGAGARRAIGTAVVSGMLIATLIGIFFIPAFYVMLQRLSEHQSPFRCARPSPPASGGGSASSSPAAPER